MSHPHSGSAQLCWAWWHSGNASADLLVSSRHGTKHIWATPRTPTDRWSLCWNMCTELNLLMLLSHGPSLAQAPPWGTAGLQGQGECPPRQGTARVGPVTTSTCPVVTAEPFKEGQDQHRTGPFLKPHTLKQIPIARQNSENTLVKYFLELLSPKPFSFPESNKMTWN